MGKNAPRYGRRVLVFLGSLALIFVAIGANGVWAPSLGLDLQGGTRITLEAQTTDGEAVDPEQLQEAVAIIDARVNGSGVAESEVGTQGDRNIVVEIPGENRTDLVEAVQQTAQLRFRLVAQLPTGEPAQLPGVAAPAQQQPPVAPESDPSDEPSPTDEASPSDEASPRGRAPFAQQTDETPAQGNGQGTGQGSGQDGGQGSGQSGQGGATDGEDPATELPQPDVAPQQDLSSLPGAPIDEPLAWQQNPGGEWLQQFADFTCPRDGSIPDVNDNPNQPLVTCDENGLKYLLSVAVIEGTQLTDASAGIPQGQFNYTVNLSLNGEARGTFADISRAIAGTGELFAIVLDGQVISPPEINTPILGGNAQITGDFTEAEAESLANSLRYGALPLSFTVPVISDEGPTLAAGQLQAGLIAGAIGLALVMIYCLVYYRGLGMVVILSLLIAGLATYAAVIFLSETAGFTLTLPGIAGLIVSVGITADSFIVFFERIRDEMREGKSMRVAVEAGWTRARNTCLAADAVSLLAAVVLYIFAIGVVKGFAFALGISTLVDLVVFFLFTKPLVSWLGGFKFFNQGHKLSGLDAENLGVDALPKAKVTPRRPATAGAGGRS
ncbi:protein translocase subunit SecD [Nocardioidaceae bacterium]|nr:protein translocase subunit SecD [Nocardioidaceae bacterium]